MPRSDTGLSQPTAEISETRRLLEEIPIQLDDARKRYIEKRKEWQIAKEVEDNKYDMIYLSEKAKDGERTINDLEAQARSGSHTERMDVICKEADMKLVENEIKFLSDQHEAALEDSRTFRAELKTGFQG